MGAAGAEVRGCEWDLVDFFAGQAGKADGVAGLIYVPAHIKGPCTWPFPNHYRRTINHGHPLIAASRKMETGQQMHAWCNRGEVAEVRMGGEWRGGGVQNRQGKQVPIFGKEATSTQTPPPPPSSSQRDGGKIHKQEIPH